MRERLQSKIAFTRNAGACALLAGSALMVLGVASPAAADSGWSRNPGSSLAGGQIRVASSPTTLCQWVQPAPPPDPSTTTTTSSGIAATVLTRPPASGIRTSGGGGLVAYDGLRVELRLELAGNAVALGAVDVTPGGAWSGSVTIPAAMSSAPGEYVLLAHCVVDDPRLDGIRSFDFDASTFTVVEGPPPTTITIPTELVPPITATNPVEVQGAQLGRGDAPTAVTAAPTLPKTGDGTLAVALAGLGALVLGAGALWWGSRQGFRRPTVKG